MACGAALVCALGAWAIGAGGSFALRCGSSSAYPRKLHDIAGAHALSVTAGFACLAAVALLAISPRWRRTRRVPLVLLGFSAGLAILGGIVLGCNA